MTDSPLPLNDLKDLVYAQAMHRLMDFKHTLEPKSTKWIYELKDLAFLLAMLTDEDIARLSKEMRLYYAKLPRTLKTPIKQTLKKDLEEDLFDKPTTAIKVILEDKTGKDELFG